jgi:pimeloyl-ACP methyl ester carboxylesterase
LSVAIVPILENRGMLVCTTANIAAEPLPAACILHASNSETRHPGCPLIVFAGRQDMNVNSQLASDWFKTVAAPEKKFVWFEHSAHLPMTEERGKYLLSLVKLARPIAERAGDAAE